MRAMLLKAQRRPLRLVELPVPKPDAMQVLVKVTACAICRTDLHLVDGELTNPKLPLVPGHEIVGSIVEKGRGVKRFKIGDRVGIPWLGWTCGECEFCLQRTGESLRPSAVYRLHVGRRILRIYRGR